jgi:hypothetical protein
MTARVGGRVGYEVILMAQGPPRHHARIIAFALTTTELCRWINVLADDDVCRDSLQVSWPSSMLLLFCRDFLFIRNTCQACLDGKQSYPRLIYVISRALQHRARITRVLWAIFLEMLIGAGLQSIFIALHRPKPEVSERLLPAG